MVPRKGGVEERLKSSERKRETLTLPLSCRGAGGSAVIATPLSPTWVPAPEPSAPYPSRHSARVASVPSHWLTAPTSSFSGLSIIYGLQGAITINNARAIMFHSSPHNGVTPNVCRAGSWLLACSLFSPSKPPSGSREELGWPGWGDGCQAGGEGSSAYFTELPLLNPSARPGLRFPTPKSQF